MRDNAITVLIPTRERGELLASAIESCLAQNYENCTFVVSDNASQDFTKDVVHGFRDPRIRYVNPGRRLSMSNNFEFALSHAKPGHVISIGDDDALMPYALEYLDTLIDETGAEAIGGRWNCYYWDNFPIESVRNKLDLWLGDGYSVRPSLREVRRVLNFDYAYTYKLAGLYYGLISTRLIERLRCNGEFFRSMTPDAYSALACSLATETFVFSHKPFVLVGASGRSNGASQLLNVNASEATKFIQENAHVFHESLVYCPAAAVIIAEAFLQLQSCHPELTGRLSLSLEKMCAAALRQAAPNVREQTEAAVAEIARRHGISLRRVRLRSRLPRVVARMRNELDEFRFPHYSLACPDTGPRNVARAAQYAALVTDERRGRRFATWAAHQGYRVSQRLKMITSALP